MKSEDVKFAAQLLNKRAELAALRSRLVTHPSFRLQLCAVKGEEGDGTLYDDLTVSNELGRGLVEIAFQAAFSALRDLGIDEFQDSTSLPSTESTK